MTINFKMIFYAICNNWVVMSNSELVVGKKNTCKRNEHLRCLNFVKKVLL